MSIKDLAIIGGSGFGKEVANIVEAINRKQPTWNLLGLVDENVKGKTAEGFNILGTDSDLLEMNPKPYIVIAIAEASKRKSLVAKYNASGFKFATIIDPSVRMGRNVSVGEGSILCINTIFTTNISLGNHCIMNNLVNIGHDTQIDDYVSIMSQSVIAGDVVVGEGCYFGLTCTVINKVNLGKYSVFGAGATVVSDIPEYSLAVGVPAKVIKKLTNK